MGVGNNLKGGIPTGAPPFDYRPSPIAHRPSPIAHRPSFFYLFPLLRHRLTAYPRMMTVATMYAAIM
jgi:hypothetical protein